MNDYEPESRLYNICQIFPPHCFHPNECISLYWSQALGDPRLHHVKTWNYTTALFQSNEVIISSPTNESILCSVSFCDGTPWYTNVSFSIFFVLKWIVLKYLKVPKFPLCHSFLGITTLESSLCWSTKIWCISSYTFDLAFRLQRLVLPMFGLLFEFLKT